MNLSKKHQYTKADSDPFDAAVAEYEIREDGSLGHDRGGIRLNLRTRLLEKLFLHLLYLRSNLHQNVMNDEANQIRMVATISNYGTLLFLFLPADRHFIIKE